MGIKIFEELICSTVCEQLKLILDKIVDLSREDWSDVTTFETVHESGAVCRRRFIHQGSTTLTVRHQGIVFTVYYCTKYNTYQINDFDVSNEVVESLLELVGWINYN